MCFCSFFPPWLSADELFTTKLRCLHLINCSRNEKARQMRRPNALCFFPLWLAKNKFPWSTLPPPKTHRSHANRVGASLLGLRALKGMPYSAPSRILLPTGDKAVPIAIKQEKIAWEKQLGPSELFLISLQFFLLQRVALKQKWTFALSSDASF